jgi:hypothetical protein
VRRFSCLRETEHETKEKTMKKTLTKVASVLALSAALIGIGSMTPAAAATDGSASVAGDPSQWLRASADGDPGPSLNRKVNEYEGQHR